ncbi:MULTISPECIES: dUTP diphosphatase [unclassified Peribacillus]|uniref:dUTP diphosphatase n=1 Tax=unclassified Peribacillus TaxID=2675266 RepID=UPI003670723D
MNLTKLFDAQKELEKVGLFNYRGPDRFDKLVLALLVELGECANEWRGFKFWSTDQKPRTKALKNQVMMEEDKVYYNPLLEEYVDGLHFVLGIGLEIAQKMDLDVSDYFEEINSDIERGYHKEANITQQFNTLFHITSIVNLDFEYSDLFAYYYHLGEMLGFADEQVEQAYFEKNKINHQRQSEGY